MRYEILCHGVGALPTMQKREDSEPQEPVPVAVPGLQNGALRIDGANMLPRVL